MITQTILYSRHTAANQRLNDLTAAYNDMAKAKESAGTNPKARAFINAAGEFQATLRTVICAGRSSIVREFGAQAVPPQSGKPGNAASQLAIASEQPAVNQRLNDLLAAHKSFLASQPKMELSMRPHRLLGVTRLGR